MKNRRENGSQRNRDLTTFETCWTVSTGFQGLHFDTLCVSRRPRLLIAIPERTRNSQPWKQCRLYVDFDDNGLSEYIGVSACCLLVKVYRAGGRWCLEALPDVRT